MKKYTTILWLLFIGCLTSSLQCENCRTKPLRLDATKSWLPLKGKTSQAFRDQSGNLTDFSIRVVDTTETAMNDCGGFFNYEYITTTYYLNQNQADSIHFSLASGGWLCMRSWSNNQPQMGMCNVFGQTKQGTIAESHFNYTVGGNTYQQAILLLCNPGNLCIIDSVIIANNVGMVGFKYAGNKYTLQ